MKRRGCGERWVYIHARGVLGAKSLFRRRANFHRRQGKPSRILLEMTRECSPLRTVAAAAATDSKGQEQSGCEYDYINLSRGS